MTPRILITREKDRAAELVDLLTAERLEAVAEPATRTVYLSHDENRPVLSNFDWLIFTSANGVKGFGRVFSREDVPPQLKTAVVGPGTAKMLEDILHRPDFAAQQHDSISLAEELLREDPDMPRCRVLWPCAEKASLDLAARLHDAGTEVVPWPVYATESIPPEELLERLIRIWPWAMAVFAAPSAVHAFAAAWQTPWDFPCVAIGNVTAKALAKAGAKQVRISPSPRAEDLRDIVLNILNLR